MMLGTIRFQTCTLWGIGTLPGPSLYCCLVCTYICKSSCKLLFPAGLLHYSKRAAAALQVDYILVQQWNASSNVYHCGCGHSVNSLGIYIWGLCRWLGSGSAPIPHNVHVWKLWLIIQVKKSFLWNEKDVGMSRQKVIHNSIPTSLFILVNQFSYV